LSLAFGAGGALKRRMTRKWRRAIGVVLVGAPLASIGCAHVNSNNSAQEPAGGISSTSPQGANGGPDGANSGSVADYPSPG
jgi:hypothetical protein